MLAASLSLTHSLAASHSIQGPSVEEFPVNPNPVQIPDITFEHCVPATGLADLSSLFLDGCPLSKPVRDVADVADGSGDVSFLDFGIEILAFTARKALMKFSKWFPPGPKERIRLFALS